MGSEAEFTAQGALNLEFPRAAAKSPEVFVILGIKGKKSYQSTQNPLYWIQDIES